MGSALAVKLLGQAAETPQTPVRYALLRLALEAAVQAGDVPLAIKAVGELDRASRSTRWP